MKAISTKYVGATNTRGSRIIASDGDGNRISIPYPHELSGEAVHRKAAEALRDKMKWTGELIGGATKDGYCFVFTAGKTFKNPRRRAKKRRSERGFFPKRKRKSRALAVRNRAKAQQYRREQGILPKRRNPSDIRIVYNRLLGGWYVVRGPHQTPLNGRFDSKAAAQAWLAGQSARRNPARSIKRSRMSHARSTASRRIERARRRGIVPRAVRAPYAVQVKRGKAWVTLASFPYQEQAFDYGRALKHRYPGKSFRVFW